MIGDAANGLGIGEVTLFVAVGTALMIMALGVVFGGFFAERRLHDRLENLDARSRSGIRTIQIATLRRTEKAGRLPTLDKHLWRWFTACAVLLLGFSLLWLSRPVPDALFSFIAALIGYFLLVLEIVVLLSMLVRSFLPAAREKRVVIRSFALLFLLTQAAYLFSLGLNSDSAAPDTFFTIYTIIYYLYHNSVILVWLRFFYRPAGPPTGNPERFADIESCKLNDREREILEYMLQGKSNRVISDELFLSEHTVKNAITRIFYKLDVINRKELFNRFLNPPGR